MNYRRIGFFLIINNFMHAFLEKYRQQLLVGGPVLVVLICFLFYMLGGRYEETDDAYLKAANVSISANVAGKIDVLYVHDNQYVKKGDPLFQLDLRPYNISVDSAKAALANARLQIQELKALYLQKTAVIQAAQSALTYQTQELARQKKLAASGISSQTQLSQTVNAFNQAQQELVAAEQDKLSVLAQLDNNADLAVDNHPVVQQAQAALNTAKLNLSYATVHAPMDGIVTKVEALQVGDYITTGAPVFALLSTNDVWIEANFKETQITHMHPGQPVKITIDAYADKKFEGTVASLTPGTGSTFSLLPPENATGNWVKIVQRVPVRIKIENLSKYPPQTFLVLSGLSAEVTVDTKPPKNLKQNTPKK